MSRARLVSLIALIASSPALAQTGTIAGTVTSVEAGTPVAGVRVVVAGTTVGAMTSDDGRYTITVQPGSYTVRAARIGFAPDSVVGVVVAAGQATSVNFQLQTSAVTLATVHTVGYGTQEEKDRTGSVETVTSEDFNTGRVVSPEELIQSKLPGVQVVENNEPGGGKSVRIRGGSSTGCTGCSSNEPLFVVDGVPVAVGGGLSAGRNPLNFLNPSDIESITVLKDASATAIYGSRGSNGVVLINTKQGGEGRQFDFTSTVSQSTVTGELDLLDAAQFRAAVQQHAPQNVAKLGTADTDWREAVQRDAVGREQQMAVAGGRDDLRYRLSLGYLDQGGVVEGTTLRRLSTALSYKDRLFDRLDVTANLKGSRSDDRFTPGGVLGNATAMAPTQPIVTPSGAFFEWRDANGNLVNISPGNPLAELALISDRGTTYRSIGNFEGRYHLPFLEGLSGTVNLGYDLATSRRTTFTPSTARSQIVSGDSGTLFRNNPTQVNTLLDAYANYARTLDRFASDIDVTAGYSYEETRGDFPSFRARGLSSDLLGPSGIPTAKLQENFLTVDESRLISFFGRVNYALRDRYLATLSVRRDGSSKFGVNDRWGVFPAAAFAWRVSEEPFLNSFSWLNNLKLRLSWGVNGNQAFPNYQAISSYTIGNALAQAQFGDEFVTTIRPSAADPNLKWEETTSYDVGLDYSILDNRFSGTIDYYSKKTDDLLFNVNVAAGTNLSDFVTTNIGSVQNRGFELGLNALILRGGFHGLTWTANFNASTNRNKLLRINAFGTGSEQIPVGGIAGGVGNTIAVLQPGYPINTFFVYQHKMRDGKPIYEDTNDDGSINDQDLYVDICCQTGPNGEILQQPDGVINQSDRRPFNDPAPDWILGHSSTLTLGNFDASFTLRAYLGNYVYNNVASNLGNYSRLAATSPVNVHASVLDYGFVSPQYFSDVYVEDASFVRMDNITVGYTFQRLRGVRQLRIFGTIQNAFTITDYSGLDPTSGVNGIDNNIYPRSRTLLTGANIQF